MFFFFHLIYRTHSEIILVFINVDLGIISMTLKRVIGLSVFAGDARSCLASGKDWPMKANKQNKLLPDPVHSQNTEEVLGRAATV